MSTGTTAKRGAAKRTPPKRFVHNTALPSVLQATQVAFGVMKALRANNWSGVLELAGQGDLREKVLLTETQQALLEEHSGVLPYLLVKPVTTVDACDTCGLYALSSGSASKKCTRTLHCTGTVVRAPTTVGKWTGDAVHM